VSASWEPYLNLICAVQGAAVRGTIGDMRLLALFLLSTVVAFAQLSDGISTSVTRTVTLTADEADFAIVAGASLDTTQQQIAQIFLDAGITGLSLSGTALTQNYDYSTNPPNTQTLVLYQFTFSVPAAGLKGAAKIMETVRTSPPALIKSMQYSASLNASQATVDAMRQTLLPQLFADAQKKAQTLAAAAGLKLGGVKGVSESFYGTGNSGINWIGTSQYGIGTFTSSTGGSGTQYAFNANVSFSVTQ
jgi:uncharacterized protein YggE